jgi:GNAT superfamily N-acetyltransferase
MQLDTRVPRPADIEIREARLEELPIAASFWGEMYGELDLGPELEADWLRRATAYFERRRAAAQLEYFVAVGGGDIVGAAGAFFHDGFPSEFCDRRRGYIYGVYVLPAWRGKGIATRLTWATVDWLRARGCTQIKLHAAKNARPIYERLGFEPSNEMVLRIGSGASC